MATKENGNDYASAGLGQTGAWLGGIGTALALLNGGLGRLFGGPGPFPPPPGGPGAPVSQEMLALTAENSVLKSQIYTDGQTRPLAVEQAKQGEQIACLEKQMGLRQQIVESKIDNVAQVSALGMQCLQQTVAGLQQALGSVTKLGVPVTSIFEPPTITAALNTTTTQPTNTTGA